MSLKRTRGLNPLSTRNSTREAEERLRRAWQLLVGPALLRHTHILRLRGNTLVLGCFELSLVPSLRKAAEDTWPELKERIARATRIELSDLKVIPCDSPEPQAPHEAVEDPLKEVLRHYRRK